MQIAYVVVPDVHGQPEFLEWVEESFPGRSLILLGDLIHRGPDSRRCLRKALAWSDEGRAVLLWGNHECWVEEEGLSLKGSAREDWFRQQEPEMLEQYRVAGEGMAQLIHDFERFSAVARPYVVEGDMLCSHAARPSFGAVLDEILDLSHLHNRPVTGQHPLPIDSFPALTYSVHGHTTLPAPVVDLDGEGVVFLDLGSSRTGRFCVWDAEYKRVVLYED